MKQHKWHKEIKAWADGAEIEVRKINAANEDWHDWKDISEHYIHGYKWDEDNEYRIKPKAQYLYVYHKKGTGLELGYAPHEGINMWETKIIGKIKLEVDDE